MRFLNRKLLAAVVAMSGAMGWAAMAGAQSAEPGVVCNVKVTSEKVPDVSNFEAWKKSFIKDEMSDQDKAMAIWRSVMMLQYQDSPPTEHLHHEQIVYDPIKMFNVYGYAMCSPHSAHMEALARGLGYQARGWGINGHSVPEIQYGGAWHLFDSSLMNYFLKDDGTVAGVEDVTAAVKEWYEKHPDFKDLSKEERDKKLRAFEKTDGRTGWKKNGPKLLASSPSYNEKGWWPAGTHGWYATMQEYDGSAGDGPAFLYEYGASMGYQVNIQLRAGERITRNWGNKGLHINMDGKGTPDAMADKSGFLKNNQKFMDKLEPNFPNLTNGRIGNGTHEYDPPLASGKFRGGMLTVENLANGSASPALRVEDAGKPGVLAFRMPSSYAYLGGTLSANAVVGSGGKIDVELSDNNGLSWKPVATIDASGQREIDLKKQVYRRYDYRLRFTLNGAGTGLDAVKVTHDIQHSQRPLPALVQGSNQLAFSAGPQESTITIEANNTPDHKGKQVTYKDFNVKLDNLEKNLKVKGEKGSMTVPVSTPGDMTRLRFGGYYRTWSEDDSWVFEVSFDEGKTFKKVGEGPAQKAGRNAYVAVTDIPAGTRNAQVRYVGISKNANILGSFRIDADYKDASFGFRPVKVTYLWEENGQEKKHEHVARKAEETFAINCETKPTMKSIVLELAE